jgi:hypothetical protein
LHTKNIIHYSTTGIILKTYFYAWNKLKVLSVP